jgi:hypothetical protein
MTTTVRAERSAAQPHYDPDGHVQRCQERTGECELRLTELEATAAQSLYAASLCLCRKPSRRGSGAMPSSSRTPLHGPRDGVVTHGRYLLD